MKFRRYRKAHNCPQCGEQDEEDAWKGARLRSISWGHDFACCSDECGKAFAETWKEKIKTKAGRAALRKLWKTCQEQSDARLCGEPYPGYDAENQLRALGRR